MSTEPTVVQGPCQSDGSREASDGVHTPSPRVLWRDLLHVSYRYQRGVLRNNLCDLITQLELLEMDLRRLHSERRALRAAIARNRRLLLEAGGEEEE